jgi:hypothetical protein
VCVLAFSLLSPHQELEVESSDEDILEADTVKITGKSTAPVRWIEISEKVSSGDVDLYGAPF